MSSRATSHNRQDEIAVVGDYIVGARIGQGSFAIVYKGAHKVSKIPVAIKSVLRHKLTRKLLENLESEIHILKRVQHDHIVELIDCRKTESHIHLIMEFCSMGDLSVYIKMQRAAAIAALTTTSSRSIVIGGLPEFIARHFLKQLSSGLEFLRSQNLIHRDIKPQNLLLIPPSDHVSPQPPIGLPNLPILKIADFGFARSLPSHSLAETLCGSPLYMAPEILRYEKYDAKADLWSVGAVLYEMVAGKPPFRAHNHVELLRKIEKGMDRVKFPGDIVTEGTDGSVVHIKTVAGSSTMISDDMKDVIRKLLKRNPVERISFEEFFRHNAVRAELEAPPVQSLDGGFLAILTANDPRNRGPTSNAVPIASTSRRDQYEIPPFATPLRDRRSQANPHRKHPDDHAGNNVPARTNLSPRDLYSAPRPHSYGERGLSPHLSRVATTKKGMDDIVDGAATNPAAVAQALTDNRLLRPSSQPSSPTGAKPFAYNNDHQYQRRPAGDSRRASEDNSSPPNSIYQERPHADKHRTNTIPPPTKPRKGEATDTDDDVQIEREYVVVNKAAVAANAFADEIAASPRVTTVARRQNASSSSGTPSPTTSTPYQQGTPPPPLTHYAYSSSQSPPANASYYYGTTPPFAIPTTNERIPSTWAQSGKSDLAKALTMVSQRLFGMGGSPPSPVTNQVVVFGNGGGDPEEDAVIKIIEDMACKAYAVSTFADSKFYAMSPPPPSATSSRERNSEEEALFAGEALVLYSKALALLQSGIDVAKEHWMKVASAKVEGMRVAGARLNSAVQWIRDRFNECLERAECAKAKCPLDDEAGNGISMEKLIYDRALEMSRTAARNELVGEDLQGCERSYQTAIWMLEAILDTRSQEDGEPMDNEDIKVVQKFIVSINNRLSSLRKKAEVQLNMQGMVVGVGMQV